MASAVIVAAGKGTRMNSPVAKQYLEIGGLPVFVRTLGAFARHPRVSEIQLVVPPGDVSFCKAMILPEFSQKADIRITEGGKRRQDSVYRGLTVLESVENIVLIHDGVRPFVTRELISACIDGAAETGACIAAVPVSDTLKQSDFCNLVAGTVSRERIWLAQTPQGFSYHLIKDAYERAFAEGFSCTDDSSLVERIGIPVRIIEGSRLNIKITTAGDLEIAERLLELFTTPTENRGGDKCQTR